MQAATIFLSVLLGAGVILGLIVWLNRLTACDPFDPSESCE